MSSCPSLHFSCENVSCDNWFCCGDYEPDDYPVPVPVPPHYSPDYYAPWGTELVPPPYQKPPISAVNPPTTAEAPRCDMPLEPPVYEPATQPPWTGLPSPGTTWPPSPPPPPPPPLPRNSYESSASPAPATSAAAHATAASPTPQPHLDDEEPSITMESYPQTYHAYY